MAFAASDPWRARIRHFALLAFWLTVLFAIVFAGANWITAHRSMRIDAFAAAELRIPLVPAMVVPYVTMYIVFWLAPFALRTRQELDRLAVALVKVIVVSGVVFVAFPAQLGFAPVRAAEAGRWAPWFRMADAMNLDYNLVPSLHVALFAACAGALMPRVPRYGRGLLVAWTAIVAASTVLTHQHQLLDVLAGLVLGAWGARVAVGGPVSAATPRDEALTRAEETSQCSR